WPIHALVFFMIIIIMDKADGYLAKRLKQETDFGRIFDAGVDTLTIIFCLIFMTLYDYLQWYQLVLLAVFGLIDSLIQMYFLKHINNILHTQFSRITTFSIYVFIMAALLNFHVFWFFMITATLGFIRVLQYLLELRKVLAKSKRRK
ncbi:MAG: CDP-alcohol phosphatidyltransferase family protein, partial [Nanoarchaeota archaeon]|nr:CDP-alcohol phosphatidyltransferase family protein [Nanoarchaeota archaeon]